MTFGFSSVHHDSAGIVGVKFFDASVSEVAQRLAAGPSAYYNVQEIDFWDIDGWDRSSILRLLDAVRPMRDACRITFEKCFMRCADWSLLLTGLRELCPFLHELGLEDCNLCDERLGVIIPIVALWPSLHTLDLARNYEIDGKLFFQPSVLAASRLVRIAFSSYATFRYCDLCAALANNCSMLTELCGWSTPGFRGALTTEALCRLNTTPAAVKKLLSEHIGPSPHTRFLLPLRALATRYPENRLPISRQVCNSLNDMVRRAWCGAHDHLIMSLLDIFDVRCLDLNMLLGWAAFRGQMQLCKHLIALGAVPFGDCATSFESDTPCDTASRNGHDAVSLYLAQEERRWLDRDKPATRGAKTKSAAKRRKLRA